MDPNQCGGHHVMGTMKMGLVSDPLAVIDTNCQVFGMNGLFEVDAGGIPVSTRWPNAQLYGIAEKCIASIIRTVAAAA